MSFDPYAQPDQPQPPPPQPPVEPPAGVPSATQAAARERLLTPAILLIVLSVLNLLAFLYSLGNAIFTTLTPADDLVKAQIAMYEKAGEMLGPGMAKATKPAIEQIQETEPAAFKRQALLVGWLMTAASLIVPVLGLLGGINMLRMRAFGLAVSGAVATAIPCLSASGCCCGLGQVVGVWCIVVLMNPDVRSMFR